MRLPSRWLGIRLTEHRPGIIRVIGELFNLTVHWPICLDDAIEAGELGAAASFALDGLELTPITRFMPTNRRSDDTFHRVAVTRGLR